MQKRLSFLIMALAFSAVLPRETGPDRDQENKIAGGGPPDPNKPSEGQGWQQTIGPEPKAEDLEDPDDLHLLDEDQDEELADRNLEDE